MLPPALAPFLVCGLATVLACGQPSATLRADVEAYLRRAAAWSPLEADTARTLERILATEFVDEAEVLHQIDEVEPRIQGHLARIREYKPATSSVLAVHTEYIRAWESLLGGLDAIERGFATADWSQLSRGRDAMARWRDGLVQVAAELRDLTERTGADLTPNTPT